MASSAGIALQTAYDSQPPVCTGLPAQERDGLIISTVVVDGRPLIRSRYGDKTWHLSGNTNRPASRRRIDFARVPEAFEPVMKSIIYAYMRRGREGQRVPNSSTVITKFGDALPFLKHLTKLKLKTLAAVTPFVCSAYVASSRDERQRVGSRNAGKPLSAGALQSRFQAVEMLYELSQRTSDPMPSHPWPETSAMHLTGRTGKGDPRKRGSTTPLIPDDVFVVLFQRAHELVQNGSTLLDLRDGVDKLTHSNSGRSKGSIERVKNAYLAGEKWAGGLATLRESLLDLRDACYIVVASLTGCRNHELCFVQSGSCYRTEDDEGEVYWWMKSHSTKTGAGDTEWMIPQAGVTALAVMDRWAVPYQDAIAAEIQERRAADPCDPEIAEAERHRNAVFLGTYYSRGVVRTLTEQGWGDAVKRFAASCGLEWDLATHQFRRKFANYAARSKFGDLRYLREHFKHWSQDMSNAYALNESQEMDLYLEIEDELDAIKLGLAGEWLDSQTSLAGGYGRRLMDWRSSSDAVTLFRDRKTMIRSIAESHSIRSNGHAWCTADDNRCIGNSIEKSRCGQCDNAVVGSAHSQLWQQLYDDLRDMLKCDDIGIGRARIERDLVRCREVLIYLGHDATRMEAA